MVVFCQLFLARTQALVHFGQDAEIVKHASDVLAALVVDEDVAYAIMDIEEIEPFTALSTTVTYWQEKVKSTPKNTPQMLTTIGVLGSLFLVLNEMVEHEDLVDYIIEHQFVEAATKAKDIKETDSDGVSIVSERAASFMDKLKENATS